MDPPVQSLAKEIGDAFVEQYYLVMQSHPHLLYKFYRAYSKIGRPGEDGKMRSSTFADIDENLNVMTSGGFDSVELTTVVSQDSHGGSVFVTVGGYFTLNESLQRNFTQVFFLAPQENGHFVFNDMFRFQDGKPITPVIEEKDPETEVTREDAADGSKIADANIVIKAIPNDHWPCDLFPQTKSDAFDTFNTGDGSNQECEALYESSAVYFKNLPSYYTFDKTKKAFTRFGEIKRMKIRNPKKKCYYGFVEFTDASAAEKAIKASPVRIAGRSVYVEKKRVTDYREKLKIFEEEGRQHGENRYRSEHLRERRVYDFWDWVESMGKQSRRQEEESGTRDYDFWEWRRSKEEQSRLEEEKGGREVDHSWDYEEVLEEQRKFLEEVRMLDEEEED